MVCPLFAVLIDEVNAWIRAGLVGVNDSIFANYEILLAFYDQACVQPSIRSIRTLQVGGGGGLLQCLKDIGDLWIEHFILSTS